MKSQRKENHHFKGLQKKKRFYYEYTMIMSKLQVRNIFGDVQKRAYKKMVLFFIKVVWFYVIKLLVNVWESQIPFKDSLSSLIFQYCYVN